MNLTGVKQQDRVELKKVAGDMGFTHCNRVSIVRMLTAIAQRTHTVIPTAELEELRRIAAGK